MKKKLRRLKDKRANIIWKEITKGVVIAERDHLKVGERRLIKGGGHALICRMIAHYPTTKKLFINAASIKPINPWKKVNLQKAELHSQC